MALDLSELYEDDDDRDLDSSDEYWAARAQGEGVDKAEIASEIRARVCDHYESLEAGGFIRLYRVTHAAFYGLDSSGTHTSSQVIEFGDDGEKLGVRSNQLRSLVKFVYRSATQSKPSVKPRATNSSPAALAQIPAARRILEHYDREAEIQKALNGVALRALLYGKGYLWQSWDPFSGPLGPDGRPTGDLLARPCSPLDVACDLDVEGGKHDWFAVRVRRNRYDLAALHTTLSAEGAADPATAMRARDLRTRILDAECDILDEKTTNSLQFWSRKKRSKDRQDTIYEYHFMHRRTPALPDGRYTVMIADDIVLFDGPLPYKRLPIDVMCPEEFLEMGDTGYSSAWDLLGMQDLYDAAMSICATNMDAFGHNDIMIPDGVEIGYEELRDGLNIIRYPLGEMNRPEMLEKFSINDGMFKFKDWVKSDMELGLSVNSVARGEPDKSLESGSALALVQSQAIEAQSPFVQAFYQLVSDSGTSRIKIIQQHMPPDRVLEISGSDDPDTVEAFSVGQVEFIDRIEVEAVNPLFQTMAGKQNAADKLLERNLIKSAPQYMQFLETGRLETVTDDARRKDLFGRRVREILRKGPAVSQIPDATDPLGMRMKQIVPECRYVITDDPQVCLSAASSVLDSFENRSNEQILTACTAYMQDVLSTWRATDPNTLSLLGYPVPVAADQGADPSADANAPGGGPAPKPAKPSPGGAPPGNGGAPPAPRPTDEQPPPEGSSMPSLPKPAENPM